MICPFESVELLILAYIPGICFAFELQVRARSALLYMFLKRRVSLQTPQSVEASSLEERGISVRELHPTPVLVRREPETYNL